MFNNKTKLHIIAEFINSMSMVNHSPEGMYCPMKPCHGTSCAVRARTLWASGWRWALVPGVHASLASNQ